MLNVDDALNRRTGSDNAVALKYYPYVVLTQTILKFIIYYLVLCVVCQLFVRNLGDVLHEFTVFFYRCRPIDLADILITYRVFHPAKQYNTLRNDAMYVYIITYVCSLYT